MEPSAGASKEPEIGSEPARKSGSPADLPSPRCVSGLPRTGSLSVKVSRGCSMMASCPLAPPILVTASAVAERLLLGSLSSRLSRLSANVRSGVSPLRPLLAVPRDSSDERISVFRSSCRKPSMSAYAAAKSALDTSLATRWWSPFSSSATSAAARALICDQSKPFLVAASRSPAKFSFRASASSASRRASLKILRSSSPWLTAPPRFTWSLFAVSNLGARRVHPLTCAPGLARRGHTHRRPGACRYGGVWGPRRATHPMGALVMGDRCHDAVAEGCR